MGNMFSTADSATFSQNDATPSSMMAELTSWGEFDSLVNAGIGGLDYMFIGDSTRSWEVDIQNSSGVMLI
jgi:hypothetical protein